MERITPDQNSPFKPGFTGSDIDSHILEHHPSMDDYPPKEPSEEEQQGHEEALILRANVPPQLGRVARNRYDLAA